MGHPTHPGAPVARAEADDGGLVGEDREEPEGKGEGGRGERGETVRVLDWARIRYLGHRQHRFSSTPSMPRG